MRRPRALVLRHWRRRATPPTPRQGIERSCRRLSEKDGKGSRERLAVKTANVVPERAAHRRLVDVDQLHVETVVARVGDVVVGADQPLGAVAEPGGLIA